MYPYVSLYMCSLFTCIYTNIYIYMFIYCMYITNIRIFAGARFLSLLGGGAGTHRRRGLFTKIRVEVYNQHPFFLQVKGLGLTRNPCSKLS